MAAIPPLPSGWPGQALAQIEVDGWATEYTEQIAFEIAGCGDCRGSFAGRCAYHSGVLDGTGRAFRFVGDLARALREAGA